MLNEDFKTWLGRGGAQIFDVESSEVEEGGRGLVATKHIAADSLIVSIPERLLLTCHSAKSGAEFAQAWAACGTGLSSEQVLACHLLHELSKGRHSFWHPYLASLPRCYTLLSCFSAADARELQAAHAVDVARSVADALHESYAAARPLLTALGVRGAHAAPLAWRWAAATVASRTMHLHDDPAGALTPFADLLNHRPPPAPLVPDLGLPDAPTGVQSRSAGNPAPTEAAGGGSQAGDGAFDAAAREYGLFARRAYAPGEQVFTNYGPHSNLQLLEYCGFMLEDNAHDTAQLPAAALPQDEALRGALRPDMCWLHPCGGPGWVLLRELRLWAAARLGCRHLQYLAYEGRRISPATDVLVFQTLQGMCRGVVESLPTTLEEDDALLRGCTEDRPCLQLATSWRRSYKRVLVNAIRVAGQVISSAQEAL